MSAADERIDLIDGAGHTIGVVTRGEMRAGRLTHRCIYVLVFDRQGRLFVHLRTAAKDVNPSHWDVTIGGVLLAGESFEDGARRELVEELGVAGRAEELFPFRYEDARTCVHARVYRLVAEPPFRLQEEEIVRGDFLTGAELREALGREPFCPDGLQVLAEYRRRYGET